jgi:hypothetical protein
VKETAPDSPNPQVVDAHQSKTAKICKFTDAAGAAAGASCPSPAPPRETLRKTIRGDNDMTTSYARTILLGAAIAASLGIGYAIGAQPHMSETLSFLQSARGELAAATPNKGGHRERALGLIDQAISEVRAGIVFAGG